MELARGIHRGERRFGAGMEDTDGETRDKFTERKRNLRGARLETSMMSGAYGGCLMDKDSLEKCNLGLALIRGMLQIRGP